MEKRRNKRVLLIILALIIIIVILIICVVSLSISKKRISDKLSADESYIEAAATREYEYSPSGEFIEFEDYTYGTVILKALQNVPLSKMNPDNLKISGDYRYYTENGEVTSYLGIDVSYFQGDIDWSLVKEAGIDYVMIRVGYRGYETGLINKDTKFDEYVTGATEAGLNVGVYFYSQALNTQEAREEADFVLNEINGKNITYPVAFDWEITGEESARTNDITPAELTELTDAFCGEIAKAGYIPIIYSSKRQALLKMDMDALSHYDFWLCEYDENPEYPYIYQMWQYSSQASIPGINGDTDINICFYDYSKERMGILSSSEIQTDN